MGEPYFSGATSIGPRPKSVLRSILGDRASNEIERVWNYGLVPDAAPEPDPVDIMPIARAAERPPTPTPQPPAIMRLAGQNRPMSGIPGLQDRPIARAAAVPDSIRAGAFGAERDALGRPPDEWGGVDGLPRSAAGMEQDLYAHDLIDRGHRQRLEEIAADDIARGNPNDLAINARRKTLELENLMPEYSGVDAKGNPIPYEPSMTYDAGQGIRTFRQRHAPTGPTQGEMTALERNLALKRAGQNPKDLLAVEQDAERQGEVGKLMAAKRLYDKDVASGKRTRQDADAAFEDAVLQAAKRGALREGDFTALARLMFPSDESAVAAAARGAAAGASTGQGR
jgi:hypothetical protein